MKDTNKLIGIYLVIVILVSCVTGKSAKPQAFDQSGLNTDRRNQIAVFEYLGPLLTTAEKPARIYYFETCGTNDPDPIPFPRLRVRAASKGTRGLGAARDIFRDDKRVAVTEGPNGIIRVKVGGLSALLQTRIRLLSLRPNEQYTPELAVMAVTATKEVEAAARRLGLEKPLTLYSINIQQPVRGFRHLPAHLREVSMDEALDAIATTFGGIVVYGECAGPKGAHFFRVDFEGLPGKERRALGIGK